MYFLRETQRVLLTLVHRPGRPSRSGCLWGSAWGRCPRGRPRTTWTRHRPAHAHREKNDCLEKVSCTGNAIVLTKEVNLGKVQERFSLSTGQIEFSKQKNMFMMTQIWTIFANSPSRSSCPASPGPSRLEFSKKRKKEKQE